MRNTTVELGLDQTRIEVHRQGEIVDGLAWVIDFAPVEDAAIQVDLREIGLPCQGAGEGIDGGFVF